MSEDGYVGLEVFLRSERSGGVEVGFIIELWVLLGEVARRETV